MDAKERDAGPIAAPPGKRGRRLLALLREIGRAFACSPWSRTRQKAALRALDQRLLRDIGVTAREARLGRREPAGASADPAV